MVAADCLLPRTPWPRGMLIGIAAAIKLTPLVFVLFFLPQRQWRTSSIAIGSFLAASLLGFFVAPIDSREYWLHAALDPSRIGRIGYAGNQSLRGALHRLGLPVSLELVLWLGRHYRGCHCLFGCGVSAPQSRPRHAGFVGVERLACSARHLVVAPLGSGAPGGSSSAVCPLVALTSHSLEAV